MWRNGLVPSRVTRENSHGPNNATTQMAGSHAGQSTAMMERNSNRTRKLKAKVLLVDDHPIVREHLGGLINRQADLMVCGEAEDAPHVMQAIAALKPDIVLLDLSLKGTHGTDLIKDIKIQHPHLPVLVLSMYDESLYATRCLRAGARGYVNKQQATVIVMTAIRRVLGGEVFCSETMTNHILKQFTRTLNGPGSKIDQLSDRELVTFQLLGAGLKVRDIAEELHVSPKTVESYFERLKEKLGLQSAADLHKAAAEWGKIDRPN